MEIENKLRAADEQNVGILYTRKAVAEQYIEKRFRYSWQLLLHQLQIRTINRAIGQYQPRSVLEIAPGPARLTVEIEPISKGFIVEYSKEMLRLARQRLERNGSGAPWKLIHGNAFKLANIKELPDSIDFIYTFRFIRHFHKSDRARLYKAIKAKLHDDGCLMFDVVNRAVREELDRKANTAASDALPVYDKTYTSREFVQEMKENGFKVLTMKPVVNHFHLQSLISYKFDDLVPSVVRSIVNQIEKIPSSTPLEWIALCKKI